MFFVKLLKGGLHFKSILFVCFSFFSQPFQLLWLKALRSKLKDMPGSLYFIAFYLPFFDNGPFKDKMHFSKGKGRTKAFPFPQQQPWTSNNKRKPNILIYSLLPRLFYKSRPGKGRSLNYISYWNLIECN